MMPFQGGVESIENGTLIFSVALAVAYAIVLDTPPRLVRTAVKALAVALLAVLAGIEGGPALLVVALALSAVGDACLSRDGEKPFLAGLASFLVAHVCYIALFVLSGGGVALLAGSWRLAAAVVMVLFALAMLVLLWRRVGPALRLPILAYAAAIAAMGIFALTVGNVWVLAGAVLFMASDGLLATERFVAPAISPHRHWMRHAVWALYYAAQLMITLGFLLA